MAEHKTTDEVVGTKRRKAGEGKARSQRSTALSKGDQEAEWRTKLDRKNKVPKTYAMDQPYLLDDHVDHRLFGVGLVVSLVHPDKINVFFQDGLKLMKCGSAVTH